MINMQVDINAVANVVILCMLIVMAIAVVRSRNLLTGIIFMAIFSVLMATEYSILAAPDVAITEAAVGAGISTIVFLLGVFLVGDEEKKTTGGKLIPFTLIILVTTPLLYAAYQMPVFGSAYSPAQSNISSYYLNNSLQETGITNVVSSVLANYRGYDTLGETIVIFTAGIAILMLLGKFKTKIGAK